MAYWQEIIRKLIAPQHRVRVGVVGKYIGLQDAYKSVYEAIIHGGVANDCGVESFRWIPRRSKRRRGKMLRGLGGIWCRRIRRAWCGRKNSRGAIRARNKFPISASARNADRDD